METNNLLSPAVNTLFQCCFCRELYQDPRILPCGHTFCLRCLQKQSLENSNQAMCGLCRAMWVVPKKGVGDLAKNFVAHYCSMSFPPLNNCRNEIDSGLTKHGRAKFFCLVCWFPLCVDCKEVHGKTITTKDHNVKNEMEISKEDVDRYNTRVVSTCSEHKNRKLKFFCTDCEKIVCYTCMIKSHTMHCCTDVAEADKKLTEKINHLLDMLRKQERNVKSQSDDILKSIITIDTDNGKLIKSVTTQVSRIKKSLSLLYEPMLYSGQKDVSFEFVLHNNWHKYDEMCDTLEQCEECALFVISATTDLERKRLKDILNARLISLHKLRQKISAFEKNLLSALSVNDRLLFVAEQEAISADLRQSESSSTENDTTYTLADVHQLVSNINTLIFEKFAQERKCALSSATKHEKLIQSRWKYEINILCIYM